LRGDRVIGLSNDEINKVHAGTREYDLIVNTTHQSPFEIARKILKFVEENAEPKGFKEMLKTLL